METRRAVEILAHLAQETRLELVRMLIGEGASGLSAGAIAERLAVPSSTLSFHLNALERVGVLRATRSGRNVVYAVRPAGLRAILEFLSDTCCGNDPSRRAEFARPLPDPAKFSGGKAERAALMNELHASLRRRIEIFISLRRPS